MVMQTVSEANVAKNASFRAEPAAMRGFSFFVGDRLYKALAAAAEKGDPAAIVAIKSARVVRPIQVPR